MKKIKLFDPVIDENEIKKEDNNKTEVEKLITEKNDLEA